MVCVLVALASPAPLPGQDIEENPVTTAEDAFGTSSDGESVGLYGADSVRGFSPLVAGNVRLEGLYYDRQGEFTGRLVAGNAIRVGLTTLGDPFPAPTGIVNYRLRKPDDSSSARLAIQTDSFGAALTELDAQTALGGEIAVAAGAGFYANEYHDGGEAFVTSVAVIPRWQPEENVDILPFWSRIDVHDKDAAFVISTDGSALPSRIARRRFIGQSWAASDAVRTNAGLIGSVREDRWAFKGGVFRSVEDANDAYSFRIEQLDENAANYLAIARPERRNASTSGELRFTASFGDLRNPQTLHASLRGKDQVRRYGESEQFLLGMAPPGSPRQFPAPPDIHPQRNIDRVRQVTASIVHDGQWEELAKWSIGIHRADYSKAVTEDGVEVSFADHNPWLNNLAVAIRISPRLVAYASHTRGLEESAVPPETAANRDEAPPAVQTSQWDAGLRWEIGENLQLLAGLFNVEKPYHAVDDENMFRELGLVSHRGVELSLSGSPRAGLHFLAGAVFMDADVTGASPVTQMLGSRPVGSSPFSLVTNFSYQHAAWPMLSFDLSLTYRGRTVANTANTLSVPPATVVDAGLRYRFHAGNVPAVFRLSVYNALDAYNWEVSSSNAFRYNAARQIAARLTLEF